MSASFLSDVRIGMRALLARPVFAVAAIATLAIGIGANTAVFSVIEGLLLQPLPYPHAERLVAIYDSYRQSGPEDAGSTVSDYLDRRDAAALEDSALYYDYSYDLAAPGAPPQRLSGVVATPSLFSTLGVSAALGRTFIAEDAAPDGDPRPMWVSGQHVVLLSHAFWRDAFSADATVVGRELQLNGQSYRVIGVMPETFAFPRREVQVWLPFAFSERQKSDAMRGFTFAHSIGRLKPGASIAALNAQFDAIVATHVRSAAAHDANDFWNRARSGGFTARARGLREYLLGDVAPTLLLLQAAVALVLASAGANLANLLLIRLASRRRELAVRAALGATPARVARHVLAELLVLAGFGGALGIGVACAGIVFVHARGFDRAALGFRVQMDWPVVGIALLSLVLIASLAALVPLLGLRRERSLALNEGGHAGIGGRSLRAKRNALVVAQQALAVALLVGAGLLSHSFWRLRSQDPGFDGAHLVGASVNLARDRYREAARTQDFQRALLAAARALPGVTSAGLIGDMPFSDDDDTTSYYVEGRPLEGDGTPVYAQCADAGLFDAMGIGLLQGRTFALGDDAHAAPVAIVDEALARKEFPDRSPVGMRIATRGVNGLEWRTIVGVVADIKRHRLSETATQGTFYVPMQQATTRVFRIVLRSALDTRIMAASLRAAVAAIDPEQPIWDVAKLSERIDRSLEPQRTPLLLVLLFAGIALTLGGIGVYGVLAFAVTQRRAEMGVRLSLGATRADIVRLVLVDGGRLALLGLTFGAVLALALARQLRTQLFGVELLDQLTLVAVLVVVGAAAIAASLVPALRAARTNPIEALRAD